MIVASSPAWTLDSRSLCRGPVPQRSGTEFWAQEGYLILLIFMLVRYLFFEKKDFDSISSNYCLRKPFFGTKNQEGGMKLIS